MSALEPTRPKIRRDSRARETFSTEPTGPTIVDQTKHVRMFHFTVDNENARVVTPPPAKSHTHFIRTTRLATRPTMGAPWVHFPRRLRLEKRPAPTHTCASQDRSSTPPTNPEPRRRDRSARTDRLPRSPKSSVHHHPAGWSGWSLAKVTETERLVGGVAT